MGVCVHLRYPAGISKTRYIQKEEEESGNKTNKGCGHTMALPSTLKSILRQKKNYGNSNDFLRQKRRIMEVQMIFKAKEELWKFR